MPVAEWSIKGLGLNGCICLQVNATLCVWLKQKSNRTLLFLFPFCCLVICLVLPVHGKAQQWPVPWGTGHGRAGLIHKRRESSLVMTEESGGPNLAAFVPLKLLMMHSWERSTWRGWGRCEENLSKEGRRVSNKDVEYYNIIQRVIPIFLTF